MHRRLRRRDGAELDGAARRLGLPHLPHFAPKAKRVIFLTQSGGPSQIELFDHKPGLMQWAGKELPESVRQGQRLTTMTANQKQLILPGITKFAKCGQSGATISEWLPHLQGVADDSVLHQVDDDGSNQPRAGDDAVFDRSPASGPAEHGRVDQLRPRQREPQSAGLPRAHLEDAAPERSAALRSLLGQRLPAEPLSRREAAQLEGSRFVSDRSRRPAASFAPWHARWAGGAESDAV
jgi:hypothetical protein